MNKELTRLETGALISSVFLVLAQLILLIISLFVGTKSNSFTVFIGLLITILGVSPVFVLTYISSQDK